MTYDQDYDETAILSEAAKVVYVRAVKAADLPEDVREQAAEFGLQRVRRADPLDSG